MCSTAGTSVMLCCLCVLAESHRVRKHLPVQTHSCNQLRTAHLLQNEVVMTPPHLEPHSPLEQPTMVLNLSCIVCQLRAFSYGQSQETDPAEVGLSNLTSGSCHGDKPVPAKFCPFLMCISSCCVQLVCEHCGLSQMWSWCVCMCISAL